MRSESLAPSQEAAVIAVVSSVGTFLVGILCGVLAGVVVTLAVLKWRRKPKQKTCSTNDNEKLVTAPVTTPSQVEPQIQDTFGDSPYYETLHSPLEHNVAYGFPVEVEPA